MIVAPMNINLALPIAMGTLLVVSLSNPLPLKTIIHMKKYFLLLFIINQLYAQKSPVNGIIIQFTDKGQIGNKYEIIENAGLDMEYYCKDSLLLQGGTALIKLKSELSVDQLNEIRNKLYTLSNVKYVNPLRVLPSGSFAGPLCNAFVKLKDASSLEKLRFFAEQYQFTIVKQDPYLPLIYEIEFSKNAPLAMENIIEILKKDPEIKYVSVNNAFSPYVTGLNDQYYNRQWAIDNQGTSLQNNGTPDADMDVDSAWIFTTGNSSIKIAIIDSGTDTLHPDLAANMLHGHDATFIETNVDLMGYPNTTYSDDGHGTCTAGIAGAVGDNGIGIAGIAYTAKIIPVRIFFYINFGQIIPYSSAQIGANGLRWAAFDAKADVLSNSWGLRDAEIAQFNFDTLYNNEVIKNVIDSGRNGLGVPAFFSAGNDPEAFTIWPANLSYTISVGSTSMCDELKSNTDCSPENWGSNHGTGLDISAPGVRISTTDIQGAKGYNSTNYYFIFNGTSASCPQAAGVMALMLSVNPTMDGIMARSIISSTCDKVGGYAYDSTAVNGSWSTELGYGRVNAYKAVKKALQSLGVKDNLLNKSLTYYVSLNENNETMLHLNSPVSESISLEIIDINGKVIANEKMLLDKNKVITLNGYTSVRGVYIGRIISGNRLSSFKFIL